MTIFSSCQREKVFKFPKDDIQSLTVQEHNFNSGTTNTKLVFENDDMKDFLSYLENLEGTKIDGINTQKLSGLFYGVELNAKNPYTILFAGNYAITYKGQYYLIDGAKAERMCQSIKGELKVNNDISNIVNQRYLSLVKEHRDSKYMKPSNWTGVQIENVQLLVDKTTVDTMEPAIGLTIVNKTSNTIEFGSNLMLEAKVNGVWYKIDNMINENVNIAWTLVLYSLAPDKSREEKFHLNYYQPLPTGSYRLVKEVSAGNNKGYVACEFEVK
jgi:hypothetical protein